eukprot:3790389-Amphidinium_carterae.1
MQQHLSREVQAWGQESRDSNSASKSASLCLRSCTQKRLFSLGLAHIAVCRRQRCISVPDRLLAQAAQ